MRFPPTRYQGSKNKIIDWIVLNTKELEYTTVLDLFSGTSCVSYMFKTQGKQVYSNDVLKSNFTIAKALVENNSVILSTEDIESLLTNEERHEHPTFIEKTFKDVYFLDEENKWLDRMVFRIKLLPDVYKQALAWFALFQACLIKRPYNLFHRKNLYLRQAVIKRSFGNKKTWDKSFEEHFRTFVKQANSAVFNNNKKNKAFNDDAQLLRLINVDLVYVDPPYVSSNKTGLDYGAFYHFLEGLLMYEEWGEKIDQTKKTKELRLEKSAWSDSQTITTAFQKLINKYRKSKIVISYREDGVPSVGTICGFLKDIDKKTTVYTKEHQYVLSTKKSREVLIVAT